MQDGQVVGEMIRDVFSNDVTASLHGVQLRFDVTGFLFHSVNVHRVDAGNQIIGHIEFRFGKQAELNLASGETYLWKRHNMLMREWDMILEKPDGSPEREIVSYDLTRKFFEDAGDITVNEAGPMPTLDVVILTGLFIRNYFQRRRRAAAAAA
ncbi:hypothetical protein GCM10027085_46770 [Spirosoma aerophilum]